jgi:hypothetical protein
MRRTRTGWCPPLPLRSALRELGYVEGPNVIYLSWWADAKQDPLRPIPARSSASSSFNAEDGRRSSRCTMVEMIGGR